MKAKVATITLFGWVLISPGAMVKELVGIPPQRLIENRP